MSHGPIIDYFRACFESDNREQSVWNIFAKDIEHLHLVTADTWPDFDPGDDYTLAAQKSMEAYRREKTYLFGAFFCAGNVQTESFQKNHSRRICAPLLLFDADIVRLKERWHPQYHGPSVRWNAGLISEIGEQSELIKLFNTALLQDPFAADSVNALLKLLAQVNPALKTSAFQAQNGAASGHIHSWPGEQDLAHAAKTPGLEIFPGGAFFLSKRSLQTRGIIHELEQLATVTELSRPLNTLIQPQATAVRSGKKPDFEKIPGLLSQSQKNAITAAGNHPLSLVIGPPGTGKSYTIAAMALDRFTQGDSVLIVGNNEHALDVVMDKLVEVFSISSEAVIRAGEHNYLQQLKTFIDRITIHGIDPGHNDKNNKSLHSGLNDSLWNTRRRIKTLEKKFYKRCQQALKDGRFIKRYHDKKGFILFRNLKWHFLRGRLNKDNILHDIFFELQQLQARHEALLAEYINQMQKSRLRKVVKRKRQQLVGFSQAIKARTAQSQQRYFSRFDYDVILHTFPIWLVTLSKLHKVLPLKREMFDLVIFDEATQCDFTSSIPALYRARRAAVVGDTKQLRFVSFLSKNSQDSLREKCGLRGDEMELNYRDNSLVDYAHQSIDDQDAVNLLDEHYRSLPPLIEFNNRRFYENRLKLMTAKPDINPAIALHVIQCEGKRTKNINKIEAGLLFERLRQIIQSQQDLPEADKQSIGLISFFRDQAEYLEKHLLKNHELAVIKQHKLRAGTPYTFQGEERDIILLSCAIDNNTAAGTYRYLNREDMFNVATSRARRQMLIFLSANRQCIPQNNLLGEYLDFMSRITPLDTASGSNNYYQNQIAECFRKQGWKTHENFAVAGLDIDIMLSHQGRVLAVDLLGFPDNSHDMLDLHRYQLLERADLKVFPLSYGMWLFRRDDILEEITKLLGTDTTVPMDPRTMDHHLDTITAQIKHRLVELSLDQELASLNHLLRIFRSYLDILGEKLSPTEITYIRYRQVAESVVHASMGNYEQMIYLQLGLNAIGDKPRGSTAEQKVLQLKTQNHLAVEQLEKAVLHLAELNTGESASVDMNAALEELRHRVEKIHSYNSRS